MGANFSTFEFVEKSSDSSSLILTFHSTAKWNAHFHASKETNKLLVIDFTATWCGPCKTMDPVIKEFAAKYTDVEFIKIDVDELMLEENKSQDKLRQNDHIVKSQDKHHHNGYIIKVYK
ncbi:Thioredoxin protein [Vigna angularis]|uniref:Thioredoxin protein n=1 Tax=Phaseolus angularis TaxID=3914 RepID=A0A8T0JMQ7_PHAAN|nr:Thioredoxin protein [Vigna angularis]